ncbi:MAG: protein translocase subunit SecF [Actinomycetota bacterium]
MSLRRAIAVFRGEHEFHIDFVGRRRMWFLISGAAVVISIVGLIGPGLNLGIDFRGGALLTFPHESGVSVEEIQAVLEEQGHPGGTVQLTGEDEVRVRTESLGADRAELLEALAEEAGIEPADISVEDVGPKWGQQISEKALLGLVIFLVAVTIYIAFRFEWKMAMGGLAALFHDLIITAGVYALVGREVTPETVIAILTILGYSLYDTVVIFDKIKENAESVALVARETYGGMVNLSLNQVFMRSVNTSLVVLLPVGTLMLYGGETLQSFAFALFVGLLLGAYSSVFLAAPLVAVLKEREPRLAEIKDRATRREELTAVRAEKTPQPEPAKRELVTAAARPTGSAVARRRPKKKSRAKRKKR